MRQKKSKKNFLPLIAAAVAAALAFVLSVERSPNVRTVEKPLESNFQR